MINAARGKIQFQKQTYKNISLATAIWLTAAQFSYAEQSQTLPPPANSDKTQYELELERHRQVLAEQQETIKQLQKMVKALSLKIDNQVTAETSKHDSNLTKANESQRRQTAAEPRVNKPVGQAPPDSSKSIDLAAIPKLSTNVGGVLTKTGTFILEPAISYAYTDNTRVFLDAFSFIPALVVGLIDLREVKRHSLIASITARYGITDRWEFDLKIPYVGRNDMQRSRPVSVGVSEDEIFNASGGGIGDIELSTRYQLNSSSGGGPIYIANLVATIPTGTSPFDVEFVQSTPGAVFPIELPTGAGYASIQPSLSVLYPTDPGVFFGNLSYGYNMDTDEEVGEVNPGDSAGISFGLGLSLNERASMSISYSHKHVLKSKIDDEKIAGSELDIGQLIIGYSFRYSPQTNINLSLAVGVTDDAQDVRLNYRSPIIF